MYDNELKIISEINNDRIRLVIIDNLLELMMYEYFLNNSYELGENYIRFEDKLNNRISISQYFNDKVNYCRKKGIYSNEVAEIIKLFHDLRNEAYHKGAHFSLISTDVVNIYQKILFNTMHKTNSSLKGSHILKIENINETKIVQNIKNDLKNRLKKFKDNIIFIATGFKNEFNDENDNIENYEDEFQYIVYNYGFFIIENSTINRKDKLEYLKICFEEPDYVFPRGSEAPSSILKLKDINSWGKSINRLRRNEHYKAISLWYEIDKKLSLMEQITNEYILLMC